MIWQTSLSIIIGLAGFLAALGVIARSTPVRWLARQTIGEPVTEWVEGVAERVVRRVVAEVVPSAVEEVVDSRAAANGWTADAIERIAEATGVDIDPPHSEGSMPRAPEVVMAKKKRRGRRY